MNEAQKLAFELRLVELDKIASENADLSGCLLSACSSHNPVATKQTEVIQFLIDSRVSVCETDKNGVTPLHRAVRFRSLSAVKLLLAAGADVNTFDRRTHSTALHRAVTNSGAPSTAGKMDTAIAIVRLLLKYGADPNARNKKGKTPADYRMSAEMSAEFCH